MNFLTVSFLSFFLFSFIVVFLIMFVSWFFIDSSKMNEQSDVLFECGFEPSFSVRTPFSNQFFQVMIIFLIFDLEVVVFLPLSFLSWMGGVVSSLLLTFMVFVVLLGLVVEWADCCLEWFIL